MPSVLAGQPLQVAVLAEVHDGVRRRSPSSRAQPAVGGQVVVARRQVRVVVDRDRVLAEAARRLDQEDDVAGPQRGEHDLAVGVVRRSTNSSPGAGPQCSLDAARAARRAGRRTSAGSRRPGCGPGCRRAAPRSASPGPGRRPRSARGSARRRPAGRRRAAPGAVAGRRGRSRRRASRAAGATALAGVSRPTALPIRACLVGYADSISAIRALARAGCAAAGRARTAMPATRAARSGSAT